MTAALFLAFLAIIATAVVALSARYLPPRTALVTGVGLLVWLLYTGLLGYVGVLRNSTLRPPGITFIVLPVALFIVLFLARSEAAGRIASAFPVQLIIGFQVYRVGVELFLDQLWRDGLIPRMLTFHGANLDILIGMTAPLVAWLSTERRRGINLALVWNVLGLLSLANVITRAALTAPGPFQLIHAEVPNRMMGTFPFTFIPGLLAPLAVALHVLAIRSLGNMRRSAFRHTVN
jgi:hypothetical protein